MNSDFPANLPSPKLSSTDAISVAIADLKDRYMDFGNVSRIVSDDPNIGLAYSTPDAFYVNNGTELPLRYIHPNGTIIQLVKTDAGIAAKENGLNSECGALTAPLCGFVPPYNLTSMKGRVVYAANLDWTSVHNSTEMIEEYYAIDAANGEIVDSWFLRRESVGDNASRYYGFMPLIDEQHKEEEANDAAQESGMSSNSCNASRVAIHKVSGLAI